MTQARRKYQLLIYQVPSQPSAARVGVWRELKRMGALYLQQSVCIFPDVKTLRAPLQGITERISALGGTFHLLPLRSLPLEEETKIVEGFLAQSTQQYDEIIENCEVNFTKEIEFETFRQNFTYAEAEEIRQDLDKMKRWYERVVARDWYEAARREDAAAWIERRERLLEEFEEKVFARHQASEYEPALNLGSEGLEPLRIRRRTTPRGPRNAARH
ncbi:MAG: hypothetical protein JWO42_985 [Chloroflexi bacterium]|nr:hypothetical protein [Chloroflexota bacterium]